MDEPKRWEQRMTLRELELRWMRLFAMTGAAVLAIGLLQLAAGRWWIYVPAFALSAWFALGVVLSWLLAREAQPWQEAPPPKRPRRFWMVLDAVMSGVNVLLALGAFVDRRPLDGFSWLAAGAFMWVHFRADREALRATEPAKAETRNGPPEEWL